MAITPMKNGFLGPNRGSMWPQEWDIWLFAILFMTISYLNKKPLYLFPKTPRSDLKCQHSIEVKKEKFSAFWHFLRSRNLQSLKNKIYFIFYIIIIMNMHRNIKNDQFLAKICIFCHFSIKFNQPQIDPKSDSFRVFDANNQMSHSCGHYETLYGY